MPFKTSELSAIWEPKKPELSGRENLLTTESFVSNTFLICLTREGSGDTLDLGSSYAGIAS